MDSNSLVIWNFLLLSYKNGLLDKNLQLLSGVLDPGMDLSLVLGAMEDGLGVSDRALIDVAIQDKVVPLLQVLSDESFVKGLRLLLDILQPALERTVKNANYDVGILKEKIELPLRLATSVKPLTRLMAPAVIDVILKMKQLWTVRFMLRRLRKKILKSKGAAIS